MENSETKPKKACPWAKVAVPKPTISFAEIMKEEEAHKEAERKTRKRQSLILCAEEYLKYEAGSSLGWVVTR